MQATKHTSRDNILNMLAHRTKQSTEMKSHYVNDQEQTTPKERNLTAEHQILWFKCSSRCTGGLQLGTLQQHRWVLPLQHMNQPYWCNSFKPKAIRVGFFSGWLTHAYLWCKIFGASHHAPLPSRLNAVLSVLIWFKFPGGQMTLLSVSTQQTYSNHIAITI